MKFVIKENDKSVTFILRDNYYHTLYTIHTDKFLNIKSESSTKCTAVNDRDRLVKFVSRQPIPDKFINNSVNKVLKKVKADTLAFDDKYISCKLIIPRFEEDEVFSLDRGGIHFVDAAWKLGVSKEEEEAITHARSQSWYGHKCYLIYVTYRNHDGDEVNAYYNLVNCRRVSALDLYNRWG